MRRNTLQRNQTPTKPPPNPHQVPHFKPTNPHQTPTYHGGGFLRARSGLWSVPCSFATSSRTLRRASPSTSVTTCSMPARSPRCTAATSKRRTASCTGSEATAAGNGTVAAHASAASVGLVMRCGSRWGPRRTAKRASRATGAIAHRERARATVGAHRASRVPLCRHCG